MDKIDAETIDKVHSAFAEFVNAIGPSLQAVLHRAKADPTLVPPCRDLLIELRHDFTLIGEAIDGFGDGLSALERG